MSTATLDGIYKKVISKTGRPDRVNETKLAVVDAIHDFHSLAFFEKDIERGILSLGQRSNGRADLGLLLPKMRRLMGVLDSAGKKINRISMDELHKPGYYQLGTMLNLNPSNLSSTVTLLYCNAVEPEDSWIARQYPEAVATSAAQRVAAMTGNRALAQALLLEVGAIFPVRTGLKHKIMMENASYEPDL